MTANVCLNVDENIDDTLDFSLPSNDFVYATHLQLDKLPKPSSCSHLVLPVRLPPGQWRFQVIDHQSCRTTWTLWTLDRVYVAKSNQSRPSQEEPATSWCWERYPATLRFLVRDRKQPQMCFKRLKLFWDDYFLTTVSVFRADIMQVYLDWCFHPSI